MWKPWISIGGLVLLLAAGAPAQESPRLLERLQVGEGNPGLGLLVAMRTPTVGNAPSPQVVTPPGAFSLNLDGALELGGHVFKEGIPFLHNDGGAAYANTALGLNALVSTTPGSPDSYSGLGNTAVGYGTLSSNVAGSSNTAVGVRAMGLNDSGSGNSAFGVSALYANNAGTFNTAVGAAALLNNTGGANVAVGAYALVFNTSGASNVAMGSGALFMNNGTDNTAVGTAAMYSNTSGISNTAVGYGAGTAWTTGSNNIAVGAGASGMSSDTAVIRIGGSGYQLMTYIAGIRDADYTVTSAFDVDVCINNVDQLGPCTVALSSERLKQDIEAIGEVTTDLDALRPVKFHYKHQAESSSDPVTHYGLIAEEVADVFPHLVTYDGDGRPYTVRYELLTPLLLSELQRQQVTLRRQQTALDRRDEEMEALHTQVADLTRRLDRLASGPD